MPRACGDLRKLPKNLASRIVDTTVRYASTEHGDVKRLKGTAGEYRLRVGDWRVRFILEAGELVVLRVLPRSIAYR